MLIEVDTVDGRKAFVPYEEAIMSEDFSTSFQAGVRLMKAFIREFGPTYYIRPGDLIDILAVPYTSMYAD